MDPGIAMCILGFLCGFRYFIVGLVFPVWILTFQCRSWTFSVDSGMSVWIQLGYWESSADPGFTMWFLVFYSESLSVSV